MGKLSVADIHATIGEYQRSYLYKLYWEGATYKDKAHADLNSDPSFTDSLDIFNRKAIFPNRETKEETINWCGEFFDIPTVDSSKRNADFEFFADEAMKAYKFFNRLKNMTGNEDNQASIWGVQGKFNLGVAQISVDKNTITLYRRLIGTRVYKLEMSDNDKGAQEISKLTVGIRWDRSELDDTLVGQTLDGN